MYDFQWTPGTKGLRASIDFLVFRSDLVVVILQNFFWFYYMSLVEIKYFNALIEKKFFFNQSVENKQWKSYRKTYRNVKKWWLYSGKFSRYQKVCFIKNIINIDLSGQKNASIPQQINFVVKLDDVQQYFLSLKSNKNYSELFFRSINCNWIT